MIAESIARRGPGPNCRVTRVPALQPRRRRSRFSTHANDQRSGSAKPRENMAATCTSAGMSVFLRSMHYLERDLVTGQPNGADRVTGPVPRSMIRSNPREDLRRLLDNCGRPLAQKEVARLLGVSERFVAYMLMEAMKSGRVRRLADGRYETAIGRGGAALTELLQLVVECERSWRIQERRP